MNDMWFSDRRTLLKGSAAVLGAAALSSSPLSQAFADKFPSQAMRFMVATSEGGGADRLLRAYWSIWKKYLKTNAETSFYPGAGGRVGYQKYMGIAKPDCYTVLFGNMGPEVLNWVLQPPSAFKFPGDYIYFNRLDVDPSVIFVDAKRGKFKTIDELIAEAKKRTVTVGVSRLAHPASIGALALAKHTGAKFNLIPLGGGRNTYNGVKSGEFDCGALPAAGIAQRHKAFRTLVLFDDEKPNARLHKELYDAPLVNQKLGTHLPPLVSARAFAIKTEAVKKHPDRFKILESTAKQVFGDPDFKTAYLKTKAPWEMIKYGDAAACEAYVKNIVKIGEEFKGLLKSKA